MMSWKGLTPIEVVIIVAFAAMFAVLLVAGLTTGDPHRWYSRMNACKSNLRHIGAAFSMYRQDHGSFPTVREGAATGALGMGFLRQGGYIESDQTFSCPAGETRPVWEGTWAYRQGLARGFDRKGDRWHAETLGYDYDNSMPPMASPMRAVLADKDTSNHRDGAVTLFVDQHVEYLEQVPGAGTVPNKYLGDPNIYDGIPGDLTDCVLNGPDTDDS